MTEAVRRLGRPGTLRHEAAGGSNRGFDRRTEIVGWWCLNPDAGRRGDAELGYG